jgi:hypothetical protein
MSYILWQRTSKAADELGPPDFVATPETAKFKALKRTLQLLGTRLFARDGAPCHIGLPDQIWLIVVEFKVVRGKAAAAGATALREHLGQSSSQQGLCRLAGRAMR